MPPPESVSAQQAEPSAQPAKKAKKPRARQPEPELDEEDQLSPRQLDQRPPARPARQPPEAAPAQPAPAQPAQAQPAPADGPTATAPARAAPQPAAEPTRVITCSGPFGKEASHLKLAQRFDSRNITYTEVDGQEGGKMRASVLYPNDPKRRLEVVWQNEASRSQTYLIVINGQSTWAGPKGLKLGLALAALEKINGKPFKLSGFDQPGGGSVIDWQGGALDNVPGCRLGLRLVPDAKAPEAARSEANGKEFMSSDPPVRAVKPIVAEILFGF